jgi:hypothetical protein
VVYNNIVKKIPEGNVLVQESMEFEKGDDENLNLRKPRV